MSDILRRDYAKKQDWACKKNFPDYAQLKAARNYPYQGKLAKLWLAF
jgi:hypothetical protein